MNKKFISLTALSLIAALFLCSCKNGKDKASVFSSTDTHITLSSVKQSQTSSTASVSDTADPVIEHEQIGAPINISEVTNVHIHQNGIDVSKWQGKIDWKKVKKSGIDFAIIRIGYRAENGNIYKDAFADYNLQQAEKNGIVAGVYFFSTAVSTAEAASEAKWTLEAVAGYPVSFIAWDCEGYKKLDSRMFGISASARTDNACAFFSAVKKAGYDPVCYASVNDLNDWFYDVARLENNAKIWVAHYPDIPYPSTEKPSYTGKYHLWQYTDRGTVNGISGGCDLVVSYYEIKKGTIKNSSLRPSDVTAPTIEKDTYTAVNEKVTAKDYVNLRAAASTNSEILGQLKNGETLLRNGIGSNGWSRLSFNGKVVYAVSSYLTTDLTVAPPSSSQISDGFTPKSGSLTAKDETNLRLSPSTSAAVVYTLKNGEFLPLVAENSSTGWSRLLYNGQPVYAVTRLLTDKVTPSSSTPTSSTVSSEPVSSAPPSQTYKAVDEQVTAKSETNLRDKASVNDSVVVYTLKNGEIVTRTGIGDKGWSRLLYNGQTVYAVTTYLTTAADNSASSQPDNE